MWPSCVTIFYQSSDLSFLTSGWCHWSVLTSDCGILISSTSYSGFDLSLVQLIAWAEDTYIGSTLRLLLVSTTLLDTEHCKAHSFEVMRTQLETLGEEFKLVGNTWWGEHTMLWVWTMGCIGIVKTMAIFGHLICLRVLWWDVSVLWGQYLHHRHLDLWIIHLILWCAFYRSWDDFGYLYEDDIAWEDFGLQEPTELWKKKRFNLQAPPVYDRKVTNLFFSHNYFFHNYFFFP